MKLSTRNQRWDDEALRRAFSEARSLAEWPGYDRVAITYNDETGQSRGAQAVAIACSYRRLTVCEPRHGQPWDDDVLAGIIRDAHAEPHWPGFAAIAARYAERTGQRRTVKDVTRRAAGLGLQSGARPPMRLTIYPKFDQAALATAWAIASQDGVWRGWECVAEEYAELTGNRRTGRDVACYAIRKLGLRAGTSEARA